MPTFIPDTVEDSQLDFQQASITKIRGGMVTGISGDPSTAVESCLTATGMPAFGSAITIAGVDVIFRRLIVRPVAADTCIVQLVYDNNTGAQPTAYTISFSSFEQTFQTDLIPGGGSSRVPIRIDDWIDPADASNIIPGDNVIMSLQRTMSEITVSGIAVGSPPTTYEDAINTVNNATWRGKPVGYWRVTQGKAEVSKYSGYHSFAVTALTQVDEDWSQIGVLVNTMTGRKAKVADADYAAMMAETYDYGIIKTVNGAVRIGPYHTVAFGTIFPF